MPQAQQSTVLGSFTWAMTSIALPLIAIALVVAMVQAAASDPSK